METSQKQVTAKEIKSQRRRCWSPRCGNKAFLTDFGGWKWCFKHWYKNFRWGGGDMWYYFKTTKLF